LPFADATDITSMDYNASLSRTMSESQARFAITDDNLRELSMSFNKNKMSQKVNKTSKLVRHNSGATPAVSKPFNDEVCLVYL